MFTRGTPLERLDVLKLCDDDSLFDHIHRLKFDDAYGFSQPSHVWITYIQPPFNICSPVEDIIF